MLLAAAAIKGCCRAAAAEPPAVFKRLGLIAPPMSWLNGKDVADEDGGILLLAVEDAAAAAAEMAEPSELFFL